MCVDFLAIFFFKDDPKLTITIKFGIQFHIIFSFYIFANSTDLYYEVDFKLLTAFVCCFVLYNTLIGCGVIQQCAIVAGIKVLLNGLVCK